jgi:hypothetical protein
MHHVATHSIYDATQASDSYAASDDTPLPLPNLMGHCAGLKRGIRVEHRCVLRTQQGELVYDFRVDLDWEFGNIVSGCRGESGRRVQGSLVLIGGCREPEGGRLALVGGILGGCRHGNG